MNSPFEKALHAVAIDDEGRACRDIPEAACQEEPRNFFTHVAALSLSKSADGFIDPKLVLSWLMSTLGAPVALIGLLVPIREAGALLPQLFTAGYLRRLPRRKWAWAAGSFIQGLSAGGIAVAALTLEGRAAGLAILACLTVLALARSVCSVSYKDVLGKTVSKSRRGSATGLAGSISAGAVILFAMALSFNLLPRMELVIAGLCLAAGAWLTASGLFTTLREDKGATDGGANAFSAAMSNLSLLKSDAQLRRFITVRGLLIATALAPPFMITAAAANGQNSYQQLGFLVLASAGASLVSSWIWGRLSDRSSRKVLLLSALAGSAFLAATGLADLLGWLSHLGALPVLLFGLMIAYQGVRLGRSTHLVDMASEDTRAAYTALSNTVIGILLLAGSAFSLLGEAAGPISVIWVFAVMCGLAALCALGLDEVQD